MNDTTDNTDGDDIGDIDDSARRRILIAWSEGKSVLEISRALGLPPNVVRRNLKLLQKKIVAQGVKS